MEGLFVYIYIMTIKKRILFCTESAHIKSGYGNYTKSILERLFATNKYDIAELSCYRTTSQAKDFPWKIYPNAVEKNDPRFAQYNASPSNSFGQWRFDVVVAHFKPDIVIDFRDIFMASFQRTSVFRNKFHWILAPTIDSFPVKHEWLDLILNCDTLLTHTEWAKNTIEELYNIKCNGIVKDSINTNIFKPLNKISCRQSLGLDLDAFIIGSVMRNQKRKLIPDLFKIISDINHNTKTPTYLYLHSSYPETIGWDIPDLLLEHNIYDKVLFTYLCKNCKHWLPMKWKGAQAICPNCANKQMILANVAHGIEDKDLAKIYNTFDLYIQYAICEGFGIPPLEAASCGVPFLTVDHGAMAELSDDLGGQKIPVASVFRDQDHNSDRVYPNNNICIDLIKQFQNLSISQKTQLSENLRIKTINKHSWDYTAKAFEDIIDNISATDPSGWSSIPEEHFNQIDKTAKQTTNNREFIYNILDNILEAPELKNSFFIQQMIMGLDNGYIISDKSVSPYKQQDALKTLEVWFNNKVTLNKFLDNPSTIASNDFLNY
jgi:glycosyltransferase involved in cell wall biosynthesis